MKKLASLMVAAVLLVVSMVPAFAATGINKNEKALIKYVQTAYKVDGKTITVPGEYITALENMFADKSVDVTDAQYAEIKAILDEALSYVKAKKLQTLDDITATNSTEDLLAYARRALAVVNVTLEVQGHLEDANHGVLILRDAEGKVIAKLNPAVTVKKTGADYSAAAFMGMASVAVLAAAGVAVKRARKESDAE